MTKEPVKDSIPSHLLQPDDAKYLKGKENWLIRMYYYLRNGLSMLNDFHNVFLGMITLAITFKITSITFMLAIAIPGTLIFIILGYYNVHRISKMNEWLSMRFSTHYSIKSFNFTQGQYELLTEIRDLLKKQEEKL